VASDVVVISGSRIIRSWSVVAVAAVVMAFLVAGASSADAAPVAVSAHGCTVLGGPGPDVLKGTPGDDVICGRGGDDRLIGRGGDDQLRGGEGDDELSGGPGDDVARGQQGKDVIRGGVGDDHLRGGKGNDQMDGRDGVEFSDLVRCGPGTSDRVFADTGDDVDSGCEVINQNDPPSDIRLQPATVPENSPAGTLVGTLRATDPDPGDRPSFSLVAGPGAGDNGSFKIQGKRLLTAAVLDFEVDATLAVRVRARDPEGASFANSLAVTVTDVAENAAPVAVDDSRPTPEDTTLVLPTKGSSSPVGNDTDADGDALTVTAVTGAVGGTATVTAGTISFTPTANLCGVTAGRFDYTVTDGHGGSDVGRVMVDITCVPDDPTATDDAVTRVEDSGRAAVPVLDNDNDADGDPLVIGSVTQPVDGTVVITGGGSGLTYQPDTDYCNDPGAAPDDTFTYTLTPGGDSATVAVVVTCVDDPPTAAGDTATIAEDSGATAVDVLVNDLDVDGGPIAIDSVNQPANGTVVITGGGTGLTYEPDLNFCSASPDTFDYTLAPGGSTATVSVTVTCVDDPPTAVGDTATVVEESGPTSIDVLANDLDADGGPISIIAVTQPANGTVAVTGGGTALTYQPAAGFCGATPDSFTYTLNGGSSATVSVTVTCFAPSISIDLTAVPAAPTLDETFGYDATLINNGNVPLDGLSMLVVVPVEMNVVSVTTGSYSGFSEFAAGEGVRVSYEKNSAPNTFTLWGSSPNSTTNTTLTYPPPGLGAGEYVTRVRWEYGQAAPGASAISHPRITGQIHNPDHEGNPVAIGDTVQAQGLVTGIYTAGPTTVSDLDDDSFVISAPARPGGGTGN
jgi:hypothetical protein